MVEVHTFFLLKSHDLLKCRVLKRNYSSFFMRVILNSQRNDAFSRAFKVSIFPLHRQEKDSCYFSNTLSLDYEPHVSFIILAYPPGNFILSTANSSQSSLIQTEIISRKTFNFCIIRLNNLKLYKKNKKYINLTKDFLTDPSFLFLAYTQIKNKESDTTKIVSPETFNVINGR